MDRPEEKPQNVKQVYPKVINLSTKELTDNEIKVLSLGPKFVPTPKPDTESLKTDIDNYTRKLRLTDFASKHKVRNDTSLVAKPSTFTPNRNENTQLDSHIDYITNYPLLKQSHCKYNLSKQDNTALQGLKNNNEIVIKESDKGGALVIMDKLWYKRKIEDMLSEKDTYTPVNNHNEENVMKCIDKYAKKYKRCFTKKEIDFITKFDNKESKLYGTPKIHKSEEIKNAIQEQKQEFISLEAPDSLQFRPIVSGCQSPTSKLSHLLDEILKPIVSETRSFIKDTRHFLEFLGNQQIEEDDILVTLDIKSLYTSLKHSLVKNALNYWINKTDKIDDRFSANMIIEGIDIVIKNNTFMFNNQWYRQTVGVGMGIRVAPTAASLTIAYLEEQLYSKLETIYGKEYMEFVQQKLKRFIDDCFIIWKKQFGDIQQLYELLNEMDDKIEYTMEISNTAVPYLDVLVSINGNIIETDIYHKQTDTYNYLPFHSCHTRGIKNNIPFNLSLRVNMIVSDDQTREKRYIELNNLLQEKGYPGAIIQTGITKAKTIDRMQLITQEKPTNTEDIITFITTNNPNNPTVTNLIKDSFTSMQNSDTLRPVFSNRKLIFAKKKSPNIKQIVCRAAYSDNTHNIYRISKCKQKCVTCSHLEEVSEVQFNNNEPTFKIRYNFTCTSKNLIYLIKCICGLTYIGECANLKQRTLLHRSNINCEQNRVLQVSKHLFSCSNGEFKLYPFFKCKTQTEIERKRKELHFIHKYKPQLNSEI